MPDGKALAALLSAMFRPVFAPPASEPLGGEAVSHAEVLTIPQLSAVALKFVSM